MVHVGALPLYIPSPPISGFNIGPLDIHFYALGYIVGIIFAVLLTRRRWRALGGDPDLVGDIALWVVPAGIIGGRIYFDITTPWDMPHVWYGPFAVWDGGLGIWGGVLLAAIVGVWRLKRLGITAGPFANAIAPGLLVAQGIGRIGNYFNKELFGSPTTLPWGLEIPYAYRVSGGIPPQDLHFSIFQPSFLYELIWDVLLAVVLIWIGRRFAIKPWGLFALYVAGYSGYRIFEESIRVDSSAYFLGLRLNFFIALVGTVAGLLWFIWAQRRPDRPVVVRLPDDPDAASQASASQASDSQASDSQASDQPGSPGEAPADADGDAAGAVAGEEDAEVGSGRSAES
jgi:prolipoprotein diacylglyceryl transferase